MLEPTAATVRLFLHLLAASIWVGGQITLAALVPALRRSAPEAVSPAARQFARLAWPAFAVAVVTGVWNLLEVDIADTSVAYQATVGLKLVVVALSGLGAATHQVSRSKAALAVGGALAGLGAVAALFFGVLLLTGR